MKPGLEFLGGSGKLRSCHEKYVDQLVTASNNLANFAGIQGAATNHRAAGFVLRASAGASTSPREGTPSNCSTAPMCE